VAVTKTVDAAKIEAAFRLGIRDFGENRVQEAERKIGLLGRLVPRPTWHLVGHLQSNKVKQAIDLFDMIHSLDSLGLAEALNRNVWNKLPVLLEVNASGETSKGGFSLNEIGSAFETICKLPNLEVKGLMTVAPLTFNAEETRPIFGTLRKLRDAWGLEHLSMGMSGDFEVAIEEGATMVRIGRAIFGERSNMEK
jgi:PLP dependent protein